MEHSTELIEAAAQGNLSNMRTLLNNGADPNSRMSRNEKLVLLDDNSNDNRIVVDDFWEQTALVAAIENGQAEAVNLLLSVGADPNLGRGRILWDLILQYVYDVVSLPITEYPLTLAVQKRQHQTVLWLLDAGADPNIRAGSQDQPQTPLIIAAAAGDVEMVRLLLAAGAERDTPAQVGFQFEWPGLSLTPPLTPLLAAASSGQEDTLSLLLRAGADIEQQSSGDPMSALMLAAAKGYLEAVRVLLDAGAAPNRRLSRNTALLCAIKSKRFYSLKSKSLETVQLLLARGADVKSNEEALAEAIALGNIEILQLLLDAGAEVSHPVFWTWLGHSEPPLWIALSAHRWSTRIKPDLVRLLIAHGADMDTSGSDGQTPRQLARQSSSMYPDLTEFLEGEGRP